jgi:hypothetical protein
LGIERIYAKAVKQFYASFHFVANGIKPVKVVFSGSETDMVGRVYTIFYQQFIPELSEFPQLF